LADHERFDRNTQAIDGPLAGLRVLAIEQFGAGPFATLQFAAMGAEVIKIEDPGTLGDVGRRVPPLERDNQSLYFETFNRGKRSLTLNLKNPAGRDVFERLVARSDVVFNNLRGDQVERLGLTYDALKVANPRIVCASLSAYGRAERAADPGYDPLIQAEAGWAMLTGEPGSAPVRSGLPLVDYAAGLACAFATMVAVWNVARTGKGCDVDANLFDVALSLLTYPATWYLSADIETDRQPMSAHPSIVPFQFFKTLDGYVAVACAKDKFFRRLLTVMGIPELAEDPLFNTFEGRRTHREEILSILAGHFAGRPTQEWIERLHGEVPIAPVKTMAEALDEEVLARRDMLVRYPHPIFGEVKSVGVPFTVDAYQPNARPAPRLGEDTVGILEELGFDDNQIGRLRKEGAL